ncbi:hypothetical protein [Actinoplanes sp. NPDC049265]|uniref:hypothetical protein n=1 Tax=Actinoplanes sp. NPDC049265 TaxID=3363902 RepID=UPI003719A42C
MFDALKLIRLSGESAWIVIRSVPVAPAAGQADVGAEELRTWLRRQISVWPAPLAIGVDKPRLDDAAVVFEPAQSTDRYACRLGADGSLVLALPAGGIRESPIDGERVRVVGEGAVAWITVATTRLAAAYAERAGVHGDTSLELAIASSERSQDASFEVWNHGPDGFGRAGTRLAAVRPAHATVDLAACRSERVAGLVRPLLLDVLGQFGLAESRHINSDGIIQCRDFTGHDQRILDWTTAAGVPSQP